MAGASGSSVPGFRSTDLTALAGVAPWFALRLRRDAAWPEKNACGGILVQDVGVAMYQGRALADINLTGHPLGEALEAFISRRDPTLENVQIRRATPTGDVETRVQPHKRWYEVLFEVDDKPDEDEDDDDDTFAARKKAEAKAKAAEKARVKEWPPRNKGWFPPSEAQADS